MTKARAYIALLALAVICLGALCTASYQSITSVYMPVRCFSEYSTDGEHFFPLEAEQRFNARDGGLTLRMKLPESYAFPFRMHMPLDHITASVAVNGQIVRETGLPDGGTDSTHCGSTWLHLDEEQLSPGGELTVTLHNPHPFGANADAYNTFLDHVYVADEACLSAQLSRRYALMHWLGAVELAAVVLVLSMCATAGLMGVNMGYTPINASIIILCHGLLMVVGNQMDISLRNTFITSVTQMSRMFMTLAALMLCAEELGGRSGQFVRRLTAALGALTALLLVLAALQAVLLYDAMALFRAALLPCCGAALVCSLRALPGRQRTPAERARFAILSLLMAALMLDAVNAWFAWWHDGLACLAAGLVFGAVYLPMGLASMALSLREAQRSAELEKDLRRSRITLSMSQIRTHFIFNVLNAISTLCKVDPIRADKAVVSFAQFLRSNIDSMAEDKLVSFESELTYIESYVALEQIRFVDKIRFDKQIGASGFRLPPLLLQPIVENAICHGLLKKKPKGGTVTLRTMRADGFVRIEVEDDGVGFDPGSLQGGNPGEAHSVALSNVRFRLEQMVGGRMDIQSSPGKGTLVALIIPEKEAIR